MPSGQICIDKTKLTPARILVGVCGGRVCSLQAVGVYGPIADWGGVGATVPLTGFGRTWPRGVEKAVAEQGWIGIFTGPFTAAAGGVAAAVLFGGPRGAAVSARGKAIARQGREVRPCFFVKNFSTGA